MAEVMIRMPRAAARTQHPRPLGAIIAGAAALVFVVGILVWDNPVPYGQPGFWIIVESRSVAVATIALVAVCQALATVLFHTATGNRILTPSILGFDALYTLMQTALVFVFGMAATQVEGPAKILVQSLAMMLFATLLYGWLFSGRRQNLHVLLLVGVVLGVGFGSVSTFLQRLLTPSEFDVLASRLHGSIGNANPEVLPWAELVVAAIAVVVWRRRRVLDVLALGRDTAVNLGVAYRREVVGLLVVVAALIAISTTMIGPMTFFGFLVATLTYQFVRSDRHGVVLPLAVLIGLASLTGAYFVLQHVFYTAGLVTVVIEFVGGLAFLIVILRKGLR
ncbi:iron chelate uptake ABC transporter family permease subunit [Agromyces lapidis]|uniref:Iron chelate uptake ABC transporter family permease subunit n=1 Tax=Agromyces lapidis TaxID=279574 RepID=A0ABV5STQ5_9MICO|nr:iron chelate uptake ABC transporter family permease subunit [Agromyces lapidis]